MCTCLAIDLTRLVQFNNLEVMVVWQMHRKSLIIHFDEEPIELSICVRTKCD